MMLPQHYPRFGLNAFFVVTCVLPATSQQNALGLDRANGTYSEPNLTQHWVDDLCWLGYQYTACSFLAHARTCH